VHQFPVLKLWRREEESVAMITAAAAGNRTLTEIGSQRKFGD